MKILENLNESFEEIETKFKKIQRKFFKSTIESREIVSKKKKE